MAVLTGPNKDRLTLKFTFASDTPRGVIAESEIFIAQLDHVVHVMLDEKDHTFYITHDLGGLKGDAFTNALATLNDEVGECMAYAMELNEAHLGLR